jgi:hypothetical protein
MGSVLLSRQLPDGRVAVAVFLLDVYCLGVKDAIAQILHRSTYESEFVRKTRSQFTVRPMSPAAVRKLVEGAVAYAADLGIAPHPDYHKAKLLFGDIDPAECAEEFTYGKDGKPFFVAGPHDTPERCQQIMSTLTHRLGQDGFTFLIPLAGSGMTPIEQDYLDEDEEDEG